MKHIRSIKTFGACCATLALAACGGGDDPVASRAPVVGTTAAVQGARILDYTGATAAPISYAFGDGAKVGDATTAAYYEVTGTLRNTGVGFGAVVAAFDLPVAQRNWASATALSIRLAGSRSTTKVKIELEKVGAATNGCVPFFEVAVTPEVLTYNVALTAANFALPTFCTADAANPALAGVLPQVGRVSVSDSALPTSGTRQVGVRLGEIGVVGL